MTSSETGYDVALDAVQTPHYNLFLVPELTPVQEKVFQ